MRGIWHLNEALAKEWARWGRAREEMVGKWCGYRRGRGRKYSYAFTGSNPCGPARRLRRQQLVAAE